MIVLVSQQIQPFVIQSLYRALKYLYFKPYPSGAMRMLSILATRTPKADAEAWPTRATLRSWWKSNIYCRAWLISRCITF